MIYILQHATYESPGKILDWLIASKMTFREINLYANEALPEIEPFDGLIIMGGPMNVDDEENYPWLKSEKQFIAHAIESGNKILGICLGAQLIATAMGSRVMKNPFPEIGWFPVKLNSAAWPPGFPGVFPEQWVSFHWHGDTFEVPEGCTSFASSEATLSQGFFYSNHVLALQFHPEMKPEGVEDLIREDGRSIVPSSPYVQSADVLRQGHIYFAQNHKFLFHLLDVFFNINSKD